MLKLYRTTESGTEYWEAWNTATEITLHSGKLGDRGQNRKLPIEPGVHPSDTIKREAKPFRAAGFEPIKQSDLRCVVIQYKVDGHGTTDDLDKRVRIEDLMNECLGWTGLGHCDGGDLGSGTMNVFCYVVDSGIAQRVIADELKSQALVEGAVIAEQFEDDYKVLWPHEFQGEFSIL
jgi:hypothetical protein